MEMSLRTKVFIFFIVNILLLVCLYSIPINAELLDNICLIKFITGKECINCGMTRAFLSLIHLKFDMAYKYNHNVVIVFPFTIGIYIYSWSKYIFSKGEIENE